jgi:galactose mutarotase-like enzyme
MQAPTKNLTLRHEQGFEVYALNNGMVELEIVPELGAKIISLKNLRTERQWLWHPPDSLKLFRNRAGDDFYKSPLVGIDECFPTIASCHWRGRELPDHGELWHTPWEVDDGSWEDEILKMRVRLKTSPFEFERMIELRENQIQISYRLSNHGANEEKFLWSLHPLLQLQAADQLELPDSTRALLNGADWIDAIASAVPPEKSAKVFATPVNEGWAAINNFKTGDRLEFEWNPAENNTLGLWLTRGGWHGHHHFAIEPTNSDADALTSAVEKKNCGTIAAKSSINWQLCLRLGS